MTLDPSSSLQPRPPKSDAFKPLVWLIAASALAMTVLMFAPVPPL